MRLRRIWKIIQYFTKRATRNFMTPFQEFVSNKLIQVSQFFSLIYSKAHSLMELRNKDVSVPQISSETMWKTFHRNLKKTVVEIIMYYCFKSDLLW